MQVAISEVQNFLESGWTSGMYVDVVGDFLREFTR
jgi:hypothetical protein